MRLDCVTYAEIKHFSAAVRILFSRAKDCSKSTYICIFDLMSWNTTNLIQFWTQVCYKYYFIKTIHLHLIADIVWLILSWVLLSDAYVIVISIVVFNYSTKMWILSGTSFTWGWLSEAIRKSTFFATIFLEKLAEI